jgi:hypothetical protein
MVDHGALIAHTLFEELVNDTPNENLSYHIRLLDKSRSGRCVFLANHLFDIGKVKNASWRLVEGFADFHEIGQLHSEKQHHVEMREYQRMPFERKSLAFTPAPDALW